MAKISAKLPCVAHQSTHKCEEEKISLGGKYSFVSFLFLFPYFLMHTHTVYYFLLYPHAQGLCLEGKNILFFLLLCPRTGFFSFLIIHMHRVSLQCSICLEWHTHIFCLHCPWHRRPLSLPPASRPLHWHPYVFVLATDALVHRRPSICWPPTMSHIILSLIKVTFFIPFERCVSLVVVAGIPTRSPSAS